MEGRARQQRGKLYIPMHHARYHWEYDVLLSWSDINFPHDWHLDPHRIPVPAVPQSPHARAGEIHKRCALPRPVQRRYPAYAPDSPD